MCSGMVQLLGLMNFVEWLGEMVACSNCFKLIKILKRQCCNALASRFDGMCQFSSFSEPVLN